MPAKSVASWIVAVMVWMGHLRASAIERTSDVFPVPGAPRSATGTFASMATAIADVASAVDPIA
jgi:hypothetical protein